MSVDVGPAAVLGTSLMLSSIALYQIRATRPEVSRDKDVFFSSVGLLCGGILVFQGWRLDPLMLFGQLMTAGTAIAFASETIGLRQNLLEVEEERGYDGIGDDDGLCESNESCLFSPNLGAYQGEPTVAPEPCVFEDGTVVGVTLRGRVQTAP